LNLDILARLGGRQLSRSTGRTRCGTPREAYEERCAHLATGGKRRLDSNRAKLNLAPAVRRLGAPQSHSTILPTYDAARS
jgi:hypothetical protein